MTMFMEKRKQIRFGLFPESRNSRKMLRVNPAQLAEEKF